MIDRLLTSCLYFAAPSKRARHSRPELSRSFSSFNEQYNGLEDDDEIDEYIDPDLYSEFGYLLTME